MSCSAYSDFGVFRMFFLDFESFVILAHFQQHDCQWAFDTNFHKVFWFLFLVEEAVGFFELSDFLEEIFGFFE